MTGTSFNLAKPETGRCVCGWSRTWCGNGEQAAHDRALRSVEGHRGWHRRRGDGQPASHVHFGTGSCAYCRKPAGAQP
jgi:hypothetical protein